MKINYERFIDMEIFLYIHRLCKGVKKNEAGLGTGGKISILVCTDDLNFIRANKVDVISNAKTLKKGGKERGLMFSGEILYGSPLRIRLHNR